MTSEQQATVQQLQQYGWSILGQLPNRNIVMSSHNGVTFVDRVVYPDGSKSEPYNAPTQE